MSAPVPRVCPWCGWPDDCAPGVPGTSPHHRLCCLDAYAPACIHARGDALRRIQRHEANDPARARDDWADRLADEASDRP